MRKTIYTLLLIWSILTLLTTCKNPGIDYNTFSITEENIQPGLQSVTVCGEFDFLGTVTSMKLNIGLEEQLTDAESHPVDLENQRFTVIVDELTPYTSYYYCYVIEFDKNHKMLTEVSRFTTLSDKPLVRTLGFSKVDHVTFRVKCSVENDFGMPIKERGVCWNNSGDPTYDDSTLICSETGTGEYDCLITGLELNRFYFVRAYARNEMGLSYAQEVIGFKTDDFGIPIVETLPMEETIQTTVVCRGRVVNEGSSSVNQRYGIRLGTTPDFSVDGECFPGNPDGEIFYVSFDDLLPNTTYYYCAYATNNEATGYGDTIGFTTPRCIIEVSCSPMDGGQATGGGEYEVGETCTVSATPNDHYEFRNWTEGGSVVSENAQYSFTVERNRALVANFTSMYTVSATSNPINGGIVDGVGDYEYNHLCELRAIPNDGYHFKNWTYANGTYLSEDNPFQITVTGDIQLVANFTQIPEGGIDALFSVGPSSIVYFSRGNLQYRPSDNTFQFAENQWVFIGNNNSSISNNYPGWIDLFGWGTGEEPSNTGTINSFVDWGENAIENGGNTPQLWRTMTKEEWNYVLNERSASNIGGVDNARYIKATVNNIQGIVLFPDVFENTNGIVIQINSINNPIVGFDNHNNYSESQWSIMEEKGCVFLPVTGKRNGTTVQDMNHGYYWSSTLGMARSAYGLHFDDSGTQTDFEIDLKIGEGVRLVHEYR